jgi:hypothetical protein
MQQQGNQQGVWQPPPKHWVDRSQLQYPPSSSHPVFGSQDASWMMKNYPNYYSPQQNVHSPPSFLDNSRQSTSLQTLMDNYQKNNECAASGRSTPKPLNTPPVSTPTTSAPTVPRAASQVPVQVPVTTQESPTGGVMLTELVNMETHTTTSN